MTMSDLTMYQACLLHSRADRTLRAVVSSHLEKLRITRMEWLLLAAVCEGPAEGIRMTALAVTLDVSLPQVTALFGHLLKDGFVKQREAANDRRMRYVSATKKGRVLIATIETSMRGALKDWLANIPRPQLETYMLTVQQLAESRTP